jgi:hypothetical protein
MIGAILPLIGVLAAIVVAMLAFVHTLNWIDRHRSEQ